MAPPASCERQRSIFPRGVHPASIHRQAAAAPSTAFSEGVIAVAACPGIGPAPPVGWKPGLWSSPTRCRPCAAAALAASTAAGIECSIESTLPALRMSCTRSRPTSVPIERPPGSPGRQRHATSSAKPLGVAQRSYSEHSQRMRSCMRRERLVRGRRMLPTLPLGCLGPRRLRHAHTSWASQPAFWSNNSANSGSTKLLAAQDRQLVRDGE